MTKHPRDIEPAVTPYGPGHWAWPHEPAYDSAAIDRELNAELERMNAEARDIRRRRAAGEIEDPLARFPELRAATLRARMPLSENRSDVTLLDEDYCSEGN